MSEFMPGRYWGMWS